MSNAISMQTLQRLPQYLSYLKYHVPDDNTYISSKTIADELGLNDVQVRKDLASVSSGGRPKVGYVKDSLIEDIEKFLGYKNINKAVIVGVGKLGQALLSFEGFSRYGLDIVAGFDEDESKVGVMENGTPIRPLGEIKAFCKSEGIKIGIITVPARYSQRVCDLLVDCGVMAIWNFALAHLTVPDGVLLQSENMAVSLAVLSKHLAEKLAENGEE